MKPLLISIPKSGTHIVTQAVNKNHTNIPQGSLIYEGDPHPDAIRLLKTFSGFGRTHIPYHPVYELLLDEHDIKAVFLYRDPRDLMVSYYFWTQKLGHPGTSIPGLINDVSIYLESDDPFGAMIPFWGHHIRRYLPWLACPNVISVKYADLIEHPIESWTEIADFWGDMFGPAHVMIKRINPDSCVTFRKGVVGDWKNHFTAEHEEIFWKDMEKTMKILGFDR